MAAPNKAFEVPYLFGGITPLNMPEAPCQVTYCIRSTGEECYGGYTNGLKCVDVAGSSGGCEWGFAVLSIIGTAIFGLLSRRT